MNAVAYKTKDGLYCIAPAPGSQRPWHHPCPFDSIRRVVCPPPRTSWATWADIGPEELCDILTREYRRNGETHQGFPVFEEI